MPYVQLFLLVRLRIGVMHILMKNSPDVTARGESAAVFPRTSRCLRVRDATARDPVLHCDLGSCTET